MWADSQERAYRSYWADVGGLLSALPPLLYRQAKLLQYDLALRYSETGQFTDVFLGADQFPVLSVSTWLLADLGVQEGPERERLERHLFRTSVLLAARAHTIESVVDPDSFYDREHLALAQLFSERAMTELAQVIPAASSFWEQREAVAIGHLEEVLEERERQNGSVTPDDSDAYLRATWGATARLLALAVTALATGADVRRITTMLDELAAAFQIKADLATMHRDLQQGRPTYPIAVVARAAGIPLRPWPLPTVVLGAMVATGSLGDILDAALARVRDSRQMAVGLRLPTFAAYLAEVETRFEERWQRLSGTAHRSASDAPKGGPSGPLIHAAEPTLTKALTMAEGFLLSDLTFRESWESHREGMLGSPEVASRYPAGLILEILCVHGHVLSGQVDDFLSFTAANRFRYYDHPGSDADSDTIGVFLRLQQHATSPGEHTDALDAVLGCLERNVRTNGSVPVWIRGCDGSTEDRPAVVALGEGCGTVAAHLLLGLTSAASERFRDTVEIGSLNLLDRIGGVGLGANVNYPPAYALAAFYRLIGRLEGSDLGGDLASRAAVAREVLAVELSRATRARILTPQDAALLAIACFDAGSPHLVDPSWMTMVLKRQRFDGSWNGEPFAAAPNRGSSVTWYSSTTLTSALCYDALTRYAVSQGA